MDIHGTIASMPRIFMQAIGARTRTHMHVMYVIFRVISDTLDGVVPSVTMGACRACWGFAPGLSA